VKTHFNNYATPPVTAEQLAAIGVNPDDLWFSPTFRTWVFCGDTCRRFPFATTGGILQKLGLTPNPDA
jgi:hypothetical protein